MLREDLRLSLPERPCCREVMLREDLRLSLPERPCWREVMLREDLRLSLPERPCWREMMLGEGDLAVERCRGNDLEEATWEVRPGVAEGAWQISQVRGAGLRLCGAAWGHLRAEAGTCGGGQ